MTSSDQAFDCHAHFIPAELLEALARDGSRHGLRIQDEDGGRKRAIVGDRPAGLPFLPALSDLAGRLQWTERAGIGRQLVAGWMDLAGYHLPSADGQWLARIQNETLASFVRAHADRFSGVATVPLQDPVAAAVELRHAIRVLGLKAVQIGTHVNERGLDEPELDPFWAAVQDLGVPVIVHPVELGGSDRMRRYFMHILVNNPSETTLAAGALLLGGVFERFPELRVVLVHGGIRTYQLGRLMRGFTAAPPAFRPRATQPPDRFLPSLYFDTIVHDTRALRYLLEIVGSSQVILGSDCPFPLQDPSPCASVLALGDLPAPERDAILFGNAKRLLDIA